MNNILEKIFVLYISLYRYGHSSHNSRVNYDQQFSTENYTMKKNNNNNMYRWYLFYGT